MVKSTPVGYYDGGQIPGGVDRVNGYGLYDMAGNINEHCGDWFGAQYYAASPINEPHGPQSGTSRVVRVGSWQDWSNFTRCAFRSWTNPLMRYASVGFRLVRKAH